LDLVQDGGKWRAVIVTAMNENSVKCKVFLDYSEKNYYFLKDSFP
jgi:hypothetical protein